MTKPVSFDSLFMADPELEEEGVDIPLADGVSVKLARWGNKRFDALFKKLVAPHRHLLRNNQDIPPAVMTEIMIRVVAETVLLGWTGFRRKGSDEPLPFSVENAKKLLTESRAFQDRVTAMAQDLRNFQRAEQEDDAGN